LQDNCCFVDVHGTVATDPEQLPAAIQQARAAAAGNASTAGLLQEADHVYNPDKQDAPGTHPEQ
jgi:hypothetical protein